MKARPAHPTLSRQLIGAGIMLAVILLLECAAYFMGPFRSQGIIILIALIAISYWSGIVGGLLSCLVLFGYVAVIYAAPVSNFEVNPERRVSALVTTAIIFPIFAVIFGLVQAKITASRIREHDAESVRGLIVDSALDAIVGMDESGTITFWNPQAEELFGWTHEEAVGKLLSDTIMPPTYRPEHEAGLARFLETGEGIIFRQRLEMTGLHKDGRLVPIELSVVPQKVGAHWMFVGFMRDISRLKEKTVELFELNAKLEKRVRERTDQLQSANKNLEKLNAELQTSNVRLAAVNAELEAFSHSVSHDLRAPLRAIDGFSLALLEEYGDRLDETGQNYLTRVRNSSQRMAQLIDDLINLSRVTRAEMTREEVNLTEIVQELIDDLSAHEPHRKAEFEVEQGVTANCDRRLIRIVLQNLLENAWKFTSKNDGVARIEFGSEQLDGDTVYFVSDNGAGFDMTYATKLFGAFHRLHGYSEFPGTGIGLATVHRVIKRHGGEVWARGEPKKGARFSFTLKETESAALAS